jgi:hypothetical protein
VIASRRIGNLHAYAEEYGPARGAEFVVDLDGRALPIALVRVRTKPAVAQLLLDLATEKEFRDLHAAACREADAHHAADTAEARATGSVPALAPLPTWGSP